MISFRYCTKWCWLRPQRRAGFDKDALFPGSYAQAPSSKPPLFPECVNVHRTARVCVGFVNVMMMMVVYDDNDSHVSRYALSLFLARSLYMASAAPASLSTNSTVSIKVCTWSPQRAPACLRLTPSLPRSRLFPSPPSKIQNRPRRVVPQRPNRLEALLLGPRLLDHVVEEACAWGRNKFWEGDVHGV